MWRVSGVSVAGGCRKQVCINVCYVCLVSCCALACAVCVNVKLKQTVWNPILDLGMCVHNNIDDGGSQLAAAVLL